MYLQEAESVQSDQKFFRTVNEWSLFPFLVLSTPLKYIDFNDRTSIFTRIYSFILYVSFLRIYIRYNRRESIEGK